MPSVQHITLKMLHTELVRQRSYFQKHYPRLVKEQKLTPWERANREAVNAKLIELVETAIQNKGFTARPKLLDLLNAMP